MLKRALLIGIDSYDALSPLAGCENDVDALLPLIERNQDDSPNFASQRITSGRARVDRRTVLDAIDALLAPGADIGLLYFAGHGEAVNNDVVLVTQDGSPGDLGVRIVRGVRESWRI